MNLWKSSGAHVLAYLLSLLVIITHTDPTLLGTHGVLVIGIAGVVLTAAHQIQAMLASAPILPAPSKSTVNRTSGGSGGRASIGMLSALTLTAVVIVAGCSTLTSAMGNAASASAIQAAIDLAVGTTISSTAHTPAAQAAKAQQIQTIATEVEGVITGSTTTLQALDAALQVAIAQAHLPPPDQAAAMILAQTVQSIVLQQIQGAPGVTPKLTASQTVAIKTVLEDVIQAAGFYNVHAMAAMRADTAT